MSIGDKSHSLRAWDWNLCPRSPAQAALTHCGLNTLQSRFLVPLMSHATVKPCKGRNGLVMANEGIQIHRSSPATEISSSRSSQWTPTPLPMNRHLFLCSSVALRREGNHSNGTMISRPSDSWTCILSASNRILIAKTSIALIAEIFTPFLHKQMSIFLY